MYSSPQTDSREGWPLNDAELVALAQGGDVGAFEALVRRYEEIAFRTAYLVTWDTAEAEDAVQDAFVAAYDALDRVHHGAPFRPWLLRIVANQARNRRRASARRVKWALRAADRPWGGAAPSPEESILCQEQAQTLVDALNRLREEDRLVLAYRYFRDLSEAEVADALGCARGTVKSRLSRALGRLRAEYAAVAEPGVARGALRSEVVDA